MLNNCGTCRHAVWEWTPSKRIKKNVAGFCGEASKTATEQLAELVSTIKLPGDRRRGLNNLLEDYRKWKIWVWPDSYAECEAWEPKTKTNQQDPQKCVRYSTPPPQ